MFLWNLEKCLTLFGYVYFSSDCPEMLKVAKEKGAIPIERPPELCKSNVPNIPVYRHALKFIRREAKNIICVQANSPTIEMSLISMIRYLMEKWHYNEIMTCNNDYTIYGSVWALSKKKIREYGDPFERNPEILIKDPSIDIHTMEDYELALQQKYAK